MRERTGELIATAMILILAVVMAGCGKPNVNQARRNYVAKLNGWVVKEEPMAIVSGIDTVAGTEEGPDEASEDAAEAMSESQEESTEGVFTSKTVILDIVLRHTGGAALPGLTLDISQADAEGNERSNWKLWVDTSDLAGVKQITHSLEGVEIEEGDGFNVGVREHVPEGEQGEYQEFAPAS